MNNVYQHEAVQQLAKEFGLSEITDNDLYPDEVTYFLKAIENESVNADHEPPAQFVQNFFTILRETGKFPEMLESPRRFARKMIQELYL